MRKPKEINVFGMTSQITYIRGLIKKEDINGDFCGKTFDIRMDAGLKGKSYKETLLHEVIHAVFARIGLKQAIDSGVEEIVADSIAVCLAENFDFKKIPPPVVERIKTQAGVTGRKLRKPDQG